jgi:hypothetical protein
MPEILVEVRPMAATGGDLTKPSLPEVFSARAEDIASTLADVADRVRDHLSEALDRRPGAGYHLAEIQLGFSLDLQVESGVIIAKTAATAAFQAQLTWRSDSAQ